MQIRSNWEGFTQDLPHIRSLLPLFLPLLPTSSFSHVNFLPISPLFYLFLLLFNPSSYLSIHISVLHFILSLLSLLSLPPLVLPLPPLLSLLSLPSLVLPLPILAHLSSTSSSSPLSPLSNPGNDDISLSPTETKADHMMNKRQTSDGRCNPHSHMIFLNDQEKIV